jgi:hypothetical protein
MSQLAAQLGGMCTRSKTDNGGAFELRVLGGISYVIRAGIRTADGFLQVETIVFIDQQKKAFVFQFAVSSDPE